MTDTLRKLAEAATPGPWRKDLGDGNEMRFVSVDDANGIPIVMMDDFLEENGWTLDQSNIDFIAAANPTVVIDLLDQIDALRIMVKSLENLLKEARSEELRELNGEYDHIKAKYFEKGRRAAQEAADE